MCDKLIHLKWNSWHTFSNTEVFFSVFYNQDDLLHYLHDHDYYEIFIVLKGSIGHTVNDVDTPLHEGHAVFIRPSDRHCFYNTQNNSGLFHYVNFEISPFLLKALFQFIGNADFYQKMLPDPCPPTFLLSEAHVSQLSLALLSLNNHYSNESVLDIHIRTILCLVFSWYTELFEKNNQNDFPAWFDSLCEAMKIQENFIAGIERMMEISGKSHGHLCYCFKKYFDIRPVDYINSVRLDFCAYMLSHTNQNILDLLLSVGFDSPSHFYHLFYKQFQTTPAKYRRMNRFM